LLNERERGEAGRGRRNGSLSAAGPEKNSNSVGPASDREGANDQHQNKNEGRLNKRKASSSVEGSPGQEREDAGEREGNKKRNAESPDITYAAPGGALSATRSGQSTQRSGQTSARRKFSARERESDRASVSQPDPESKEKKRASAGRGTAAAIYTGKEMLDDPKDSFQPNLQGFERSEENDQRD